jgi:Ca2+/Na+ antiporter
MMMILKLIPIYTIWNEKITRKDIIATFILFMIYLAWILLNKKSIFEITEKTKRMIIDNKNILPGMVFIEKLGI